MPVQAASFCLFSVVLPWLAACCNSAESGYYDRKLLSLGTSLARLILLSPMPLPRCGNNKLQQSCDLEKVLLHTRT